MFSQLVDASSACSAGTCSVALTSDLYAGSYTWWIAGKKLGWHRPYSSMNFVVSVTPGPVQRISPTGTITQRQPSLTWQRNLDVFLVRPLAWRPTGTDSFAVV